MPYVFLSHAHEDKGFARKLAADLRNAGHSVWIDEAALNIGDSLVNKISEGLSQVDFVVAVLSQTSIKSAWVDKELEIASNREIREKRVVVLPLLIHDVPLPNFLQGKVYGDFRTEEIYAGSLELLLRALGPSVAPPAAGKDEVAMLREKLKAVRQLAASEAAAARRASEAAFQGKSESLKEAIEEANERYPSHAPINRTYAFEIGEIIVTLDYALWVIAKSMHRGSHPLATLLSIEQRWSDLENMMEAYSDMIERQPKSAKKPRRRSSKGKT
jgi:hypothetical protein